MMGLLYGWATKEYLFEKMSFKQIIMYLNYGLELKYPKAEGESDNTNMSMVGKSGEEIRKEKVKLKKQFGENIEGL